MYFILLLNVLYQVALQFINFQFQLHEPPFSSCLFFELYEGFENPYVQIFYKNSDEPNVPALNIPGCGTKCSLKKLYDLYAIMLPKKNFDYECTLKNGEYIPRKEIAKQFNEIYKTYSMVGNLNKAKFNLF